MPIFPPSENLAYAMRKLLEAQEALRNEEFLEMCSCLLESVSPRGAILDLTLLELISRADASITYQADFKPTLDFCDFLNSDSFRVLEVVGVNTLRKLCQVFTTNDMFSLIKPFLKNLGEYVDSHPLKDDASAEQVKIYIFYHVLLAYGAKSRGDTDALNHHIDILEALQWFGGMNMQYYVKDNIKFINAYNPSPDKFDSIKILRNRADHMVDIAYKATRGQTKLFHDAGDMYGRLFEKYNAEFKDEIGSMYDRENFSYLLSQLITCLCELRTYRIKDNVSQDKISETEEALVKYAEYGLTQKRRFWASRVANIAYYLSINGFLDLAREYYEFYEERAAEPEEANYIKKNYSRNIAGMAMVYFRLSKEAMDEETRAGLYRKAMEKVETVKRGAAMDDYILKMIQKITVDEGFDKELHANIEAVEKKLKTPDDSGAASRVAVEFLKSYTIDKTAAEIKLLTSVYFGDILYLTRLCASYGDWSEILGAWYLEDIASKSKETVGKLERIRHALKATKEKPELSFYLRSPEFFDKFREAEKKLKDVRNIKEADPFLGLLLDNCHVYIGEPTGLQLYLENMIGFKPFTDRIKDFRSLNTVKNLILCCKNSDFCIHAVRKFLEQIKVGSKPNYRGLIEYDLGVRLLNDGRADKALEWVNRSIVYSCPEKRIATKKVIQARLKEQGLMAGVVIEAELERVKEQLGAVNRRRCSDYKAAAETIARCMAEIFSQSENERLYYADEILKWLDVALTNEKLNIFSELKICSDYSKKLDSLVKNNSDKMWNFWVDLMNSADHGIDSKKLYRCINQICYLLTFPILRSKFRDMVKISGVMRASETLKATASELAVLPYRNNDFNDIQELDIIRFLDSYINGMKDALDNPKVQDDKEKRETIYFCLGCASQRRGYEKDAETYYELSGMKALDKSQKSTDKNRRELAHCPTELGAFLKSIDSEPMKYLSHKMNFIDSDGYAVVEGLKMKASELRDLLRKKIEDFIGHGFAPPRIVQLLRSYFMNPEGWDAAYYGYDPEGRVHISSVHHESWANFNKDIEAGIFPLNDDSIQCRISAGDFKKSVRFWKGNPVSMIFQKYREEDPNAKIIVAPALLEADFYCSTTDVNEAILTILRDMRKYCGQEAELKIEVGYTKNEGNRTHHLTISHIGSKPSMSATDYEQKLQDNGGDNGRVRNLLRNVCDWAVEAHWKKPLFTGVRSYDVKKQVAREPKRIYNLRDITRYDEYVTPDIPVDVFRHILTFYN